MEDILKTECLDGDLGLFFGEFYPNVKYLYVLIDECGLNLSADVTTGISSTTADSAAARCLATSGIAIAAMLLVLMSVF